MPCSKRERLRAADKRYYHTEKGRAKREQTYKRARGIGFAEREALLVAQDTKCAVCGEVVGFNGRGGCARGCAVVDHCHTSGKIRGVLCGRCNTVLGLLKDSTELALKAGVYLERHRG